MENKEFKRKYPHVVIQVAPTVRHDSDVTQAMLQTATHNLHCLFDALPPHQRTILSKHGFIICIGTENQSIRSQDARGSFAIELDARALSAFEYKPGVPLNDRQRHAEFLFNEEVVHTLYTRLDCSKLFLNAARNDLKQSNPLRDRLLDAVRRYYSYPTDGNMISVKKPLEDYRWNKLKEVPVEIAHAVNFLHAANRYGGVKLFAHQETQQALDAYGDLALVPPERLRDSIQNFCTLAFPESYPLYRDYEKKLLRQAEMIRENPRDFPALQAELTEERAKRLKHSWDTGFEYLLEQHRR